MSRILVAGAMLAVALTARRNIVLFALVAAPLTAEAVHLPAREWNAKWTRAVLFAAALLMLGWAWFPLSGTYYRMVRVPARFGLGATPVFFPYGLPEYLKRIRLEGNVYNSNNVGGFFLYHFYPSSLPLATGASRCTTASPAISWPTCRKTPGHSRKSSCGTGSDTFS